MSASNGCCLRETDVYQGLPPGIHALLVEDVSSFFETDPTDWTDPEWTAHGVERVMGEYHLTGDNQHHPVLAVGAPMLSIDNVFTRHFEIAFTDWLCLQRDNYLDANFVVLAYGLHERRTLLIQPSHPGGRLIEIRIYTREFFEKNNDPWLTILESLDLGLHFDVWRDDPQLTLRERLDYGDAYGLDDDPHCVTLMSVVTGPNDNLEVGLPYFVPAPPGPQDDDDEELWSETDEGSTYFNDQPLI